MATAEQALAHYGITIEDVRGFISSNLDQPEVIFNTASEFYITTQMLSEISGYSTPVIKDYFLSLGLDTQLLDEIKLLISYDPGSLAPLVNFNERTENLSTASLKEKVKSMFSVSDYESFFTEIAPYQDDDGIYTPDELGVTHLGNVPATIENMESIFYGTLINIEEAFDLEEREESIQIGNNGDVEKYTLFLRDALLDGPATPPSTQTLESVTLLAAQNSIEDYLTEGSNEVYREPGILGHSFIGFTAYGFDFLYGTIP